MKSSMLGSATLGVTLLASVVDAQSASLENAAPEYLEAAVDAIYAELGAQTPGCAVGVTRNGNFVLAKGYGSADLEHGAAITPDSVFRVGSVSKQVTAAAIALLAARGEIDLQADVHTYLPELMDYGVPVTVEQMVHHTSGMGGYSEAFEVRPGTPFRFGNEDFWTIEEFYDAVTRQPLLHDPETQFSYSNLAYFLLSQIVERVSGHTLADYAQAEFFTPMGMHSTLMNDNVNQVIANRATGYRALEEGGFETFDTNLDWVGDGGLYTTINDFRLWDNALSQNTLPEGIAATMLAPFPDAALPESNNLGPEASYGYGMFLGERDGVRLEAHNGGWVAFSALHRRAPDLSVSVFAFCNGTQVSGPGTGMEVFERVLAGG